MAGLGRGVRHRPRQMFLDVPLQADADAADQAERERHADRQPDELAEQEPERQELRRSGGRTSRGRPSGGRGRKIGTPPSTRGWRPSA